MDIINLYSEHTNSIHSHYDAICKIIEGMSIKPEGNCFYYHQSLQVYPELINKRANILHLAKICGEGAKIAEIGLNAGHSAVLLAMPYPTTEIVFFDICSHPYVKPCFNYLKQAFPNSMALIEGDSMITLPLYAQSHANEFDLVHVDGGHAQEIFMNDFACAIKMVKVGGIIIVDDTNIHYINQEVNAKISASVVEEVKDMLYTVGYQHRVVRRLI